MANEIHMNIQLLILCPIGLVNVFVIVINYFMC